MKTSQRLPIRRILVSTLALGLLAATSPGVPRVGWQRPFEILPEDAPQALARDASGGLAFGGARSVRVIDASGQPETRLRRGPVLDLAFDTRGDLWVATSEGLYRVAPDGDARRESLGAGADEVRPLRLAAAAGLVAAATDRGVYWRDPVGPWRRLRIVPGAPTSLVALRPRGEGVELWSVGEGELWISVRGLAPGAAWRSQGRVPLPLAPREGGARDLVFDLPEADAVLVLDTRLLARDGTGRWSVIRPALPPGARATRLARAFGSLWLATDAGLLSASTLRGPWRRAASPLGSLPVVALLGGDELVAATHRGLERGLRETVPSPPALSGNGAHAATVARLHRAALRTQGLRPERLHELNARVRRRGWWPEVDLHVGYRDARDRRRDRDQSFVSGATRHLTDREDDHGRDLDFGATLRWELGDLAYHPEELDALRETRSWIALRDDVLDEVTSLYFERLEMLARSARATAPGERAELSLRAAALAAGLDAWTGGAFSAVEPVHTPGSTPQRVPDGG